MRNESNAILFSKPALDPFYVITGKNSRASETNPVAGLDEINHIGPLQVIPPDIKWNEFRLGRESEVKEENVKELARDIFNETDENRELKVTEFHNYLKSAIKTSPERYLNLLENIPSEAFDQELHGKSNLDEIQFENKKFLLKFLRAGNYNCDIATEVLINYIRLMKNHPRYYIGSLHPDKIQRVFNEQIHTVLLHRDKFGRRVFIFRPGKWDPDTISFTDCYCAMYMLCEMIALEPMTQIAGCTVVCEGSNLGFKQLKSIGLEDIKNSANFVKVKQTKPNYFLFDI